jgi:16S rRNA U516 pseudouridylate synthase RsuA-like enzyme
MTTATANKLSAIQKAQKHYQVRLNGELKKHTVEEWDLDVYYRDITTLKQEAKIVELAQQNKTVEALVEAIIAKALDKEGKPLFTSYDKVTLMNEADPNVVLSLSRILNGGDLPSVDDISKN